MEPTQYLEITSARRNRNENPLPSYFDIPLSQSGQKSAIDALDPVCLAAPLLQWQSNNFNMLDHTSSIIVMIDDITSIGNSFSTTTLIINTTGIGTSGRGSLQIKQNYYNGSVAMVGNGTTYSTDRRRIVDYTYLGEDIAQISIESSFVSVIAGSTLLYIADPTDINTPNYTNPYIFIPSTPFASNIFNSYLIFNMTACESRKILSFDKTTHLIGINTSGSVISTNNKGPVTNWTASDIYSLRKVGPSLCINNLNGDIVNNDTTFRSFNLSITDANSIPNFDLSGSFLEVEMNDEIGPLFFQGGGNLSTTVQLDITSNLDNYYYNGALLRVISGASQGQITTILSYIGATQIATLKDGFTNLINVGDQYTLLFKEESRRIIKYVDCRSSAVGGSLDTVNFPLNNFSIKYINNYYNDLFIDVTGKGIRKIIDYTVIAGTSAIATIDTNGNDFTSPVVFGDLFTITSGVIEGGKGQFTYSIATQPAYILPFSYDNLFPFINASSQIANAVQWYEIELINVILPNQILDSGFGSLITFYQSVYIELCNNNTTGNTGNSIISNNSNAVGMTFRCTIDDVPNPINSTFIKINGDNMTQLVRFDPQDNLHFAVYLSNSPDPNTRQLFKVLPPEFFSPRTPNPIIQISALFSLKKVILKK